MPSPKYRPEEVVQRGHVIYDQQIWHHIQPEHQGRFVVIDIETGDYEIGDDDLSATKCILTRRPDAMTYGLRVGSPAAYRIGIRSTTPTR